MLKKLCVSTILFFVVLVINPSSVFAADYTAEYWDINNTTSPAIPGTSADLTNTTSTIDFNWGTGAPVGAGDGFVARYTKTETLTAGDYYFETTSDDGSRVYVDNVLVVNAWVDQSLTTTSNTVTLTAGSHDIRVEYYENAADAEMHFFYVNTNGPYFSDEFDVTTTTTLASVTPDVGKSWSQLINNGRTLQVASYNDHVTTLSNGANVGALYVANGTYPNADYQVSSVVNFAAGDSNYTRTLAARIQDANNMYILRYSNRDLWIYKRVAGTWTLLNSGSGTINGNTTSPYHGDTVTLRVEGTTISGLVNGVEKVTTTDSSITAAGQAGLGTGRVNISTDDSGTGVGMDDFLATGLQDVTAPTVSTYNPTDGATGVSTTANLVLTFNEAVDVESGADNDIVIKESSDNSTIETIDSQDAKITGTGTTTITINPDATLGESTGYYVQIGADTFDDSAGNSYVGISDTTTWNFTIGDFSGPSITSVSSTGADNGGTITWTTDEISSSQIEYGLTSSFGTTTSEVNTSPRVTNHSVDLSSLQSCRRYYFRVKSTDASSNQSISSSSSFITTNCPVTSITAGTESAITTASGGEFEYTNNSSVAKLTIPSSFASENADFQINRLNTAGMPTAPTGKSLSDENIFDLSAVNASDADLTSFDNNVTFTITYGANTEAEFTESTLDVYRYNTGTTSWDDQNCTLDSTANTLTCSLSTFSTYALFGDEVSSSSSSSSSSSDSSTSQDDGVCRALAPVGTPDLFRIDTTKDTATLFFTPVLGSNQYYLSFSTNSDALEHGAELSLGSLGVQSYTVNLLDSSKTYYFKVRSQNGCKPGDWSNIKAATTQREINISSTSLDSNIIDKVEKESITNSIKNSVKDSIEKENQNEIENNINQDQMEKDQIEKTSQVEESKPKFEGLKKSISNNLFAFGETIQGISETIGYKIINFGYTFIDEPTQIYNVEVLVISPNEAKISWKTNHPANGKVNYGLDESYPLDTQSDKLVTQHEFILDNLDTNTTYHFEVMSQAKSYVYDANRQFKTLDK